MLVSMLLVHLMHVVRGVSEISEMIVLCWQHELFISVNLTYILFSSFFFMDSYISFFDHKHRCIASGNADVAGEVQRGG